MEKQSGIKVFEDIKVRTVWDAEQEKWYFSIIDVIEVLTGTDRPRKYWSDLKSKLKKEGSQLSDFIGQPKLKSADGKAYKTDVADTEQLFRLIQSIPSPKAEPIKLWLAQVASERSSFNDFSIRSDRVPPVMIALGSGIHIQGNGVSILGINQNFFSQPFSCQN